AQVDAAVVAERRDRLARARVDRGQMALVDIEEPPVRAILALPVADAACADLAFVGVHPDLLARRRVERDDRAALREHVHHAVDDDRIEEVVLAGLVGPSDLQLRDVALVDLSERRVLRRIDTAEILIPRAIVGAVSAFRGGRSRVLRRGRAAGVAAGIARARRGYGEAQGYETRSTH